MHRILVAYLRFRSPFLVATLIIPVLTWAMGVRVTSLVIRIKKEIFDGVDAVALEYGEAPRMADG